MADSSYRLYRGNDPYARSAAAPAAPSHEPANDPLAELARLIGQSDPFAELRRDGRSPDGEPHHDDDQQAHGDWASDGYDEPNSHGATPAAESYSAPQYEDEQLAERPYPGAAPRFDDRRYDRAHDDRGDREDPSLFQTRQPAHFVSEPSAHGYEDEHDDRQQHDVQEEHDALTDRYQPEDEYYDDAPNRRRRPGLVVVMAVLGLAVLGTAGAFAYRAMFGGAMLPSLPPIIKASNTPNKVVPAGQSTDPNKAADRVASTGQSEQVVSREEQPVELKEPPKVAPRVISTIPVAPTAPATPAALPPPSAAAATPAPPATATPEPASGGGAPKKIRTVTIRPDQAGGSGANAVPPLSPSRGATRSVTPRAAPPAAAPTGNEPLALVPTTGQTEGPAPSHGRVRTSLTRTSTPPAERAVSGGGYAVQVSSQHSEAEAHAAFKSLQSRFPNQLGGREVIVRRADLGSKGVYYRALVGPFASMEEAAGMCSSLKAAGGNCLIQRN
jgi:hypothetical protein